MSDNENKKDKYEDIKLYVKYTVITLFIISFCYFMHSKYGKDLLLLLLKGENKLVNMGLIGVIFFIIISVILNSTTFMYLFINISCGFLFGFKKGFIIAYIIVVLSSISSFYVSKFYFKENIDSLINKYDKMKNIFDKQNKFNMIDWIKYSVITRLSPLPFNAVNYFWGDTNINIIYYIIGTMIGVIPYILLEIFTGSNIKSIHKLIYN
tara:strand:- start:2592 stop:3218 length:627 start_codon:yes stop_codon:yes gene_type:complete